MSNEDQTQQQILTYGGDRNFVRAITKGFASEQTSADLVIKPVYDTNSLNVLAGLASALIFRSTEQNYHSLHLIERLRAAEIQIPIVIVSPLSSIDHRIAGFKAGADDYVSEPFAMVELVVRVLVARRRFAPEQIVHLRCGPLLLDLIKRTVHRDGREIILQPMEFRLLEHLAQNAGLTLDRSLILQAVWSPGSALSALDIQLSKLRKKVDLPGEDELIVTVRGEGVRLGPPRRLLAV